MSRLRGGLFGCGMISEFHLRGWQRIPEVGEGAVHYQGTLTRGDSSRLRTIRRGELVLDETRSPYDDYLENFYPLQREPVDCMRSGRTPVQSTATSLRALASTFAAYRSAEEGRPVALADLG